MTVQPPAAPPFSPLLTRALPDLAAYTRHFSRIDIIPVLADTADALEGLRAHEDLVDANTLGEMMSGDPLMSLKVLAHAATHRATRWQTDTETVISTLVMMGITPFFTAFGPQPTVEERLADAPDALAGLRATLRRAHRGANIALGLAVHRMDPDAAVIHAAALLHDFAEMLLWCHAPTLALQIQRAQQADATLRSRVVQRELLNIEMADLQQALMKAWRLPELLVRMSDDRHAEHPSVRNVMLALRVARHSAHGWENAAIPDDVNDIAALLNLSPAAALALLQSI